MKLAFLALVFFDIFCLSQLELEFWEAGGFGALAVISTALFWREFINEL